VIDFDETTGKMIIKLVYYGPALSGKTTNLLRLHDLLCEEGRGDLMMLDTKDDRTIYYDLLPLFVESPGGLRLKVKVFTVPGQVRHDATRKAVLQRADGVAFIADSQYAEATNNRESFANLEENLRIVGLDLERLPIVVQFNKRDLNGVVPEEEIRKRWEPSGIPVVMASALEGWGVVETFKILLDRTYTALDRYYRLNDRYGLEKKAFIEPLIRTRAKTAVGGGPL